MSRIIWDVSNVMIGTNALNCSRQTIIWIMFHITKQQSHQEFFLDKQKKLPFSSEALLSKFNSCEYVLFSKTNIHTEILTI